MYIDSNNIFQQIGLTDNKNDITFEEQKPLIATIQIQLGQGQPVPLQIRQADDPDIIASTFCRQYQLNQMARSIIKTKIIQALKRQQTLIVSKKSSYQQRMSIKKKTSSPFKNGDMSISGKYSKSPVKNDQKKKKINSQEIGKKLYQKGMKSNQRNQEYRLKQKLQQDKLLQKNLTFKPKLNEVSEKIVQIRKNYGEEKAKRKSPKKPIGLADELIQCTFKPKINKVSQKIIQQKNREQQNRIQELYYDSVRMNQKKKNLAQKTEYSYHPIINQKSKQAITETFLQRLQRTIDKIKKNQINRKYQNDPQCSFVPKIGRAPKISRNKQNLPIGDYLQNCQKSKSTLKESHFTSTQSNITKNKKTDIIYQNLIFDKIGALFKMLDSNDDGLISPQHIQIEKLSSNTLIFLKPLFQQLEEMEAVLDEGLFRKAMLKLFQTADINTRSRFLTQKCDKPLQQNYSFRPTINTKSRKILLDTNKNKINVYQQSMKTKKKTEQKIKKLKEQQQQRQLVQCSFKPLINSNSQIYLKKIIGKRSINFQDSLDQN